MTRSLVLCSTAVLALPLGAAGCSSNTDSKATTAAATAAGLPPKGFPVVSGWQATSTVTQGRTPCQSNLVVTHTFNQ